VFERPPVDDGPVQRLRTGINRLIGEGVIRAWEAAIELGAIGPDTRRGKRFGRIGARSIIDRNATSLAPDLAKIAADAEVIKKMEDTGVELVAGTPAELAKFQRAEIERWAKVIKDAGIKAE
jgi:hypothetical protein